MNGAMSAIGTERTLACALHMSAFDPADMIADQDLKCFVFDLQKGNPDAAVQQRSRPCEPDTSRLEIRAVDTVHFCKAIAHIRNALIPTTQTERK